MGTRALYALGPMGPGPKGQSAQRAHRPMAQGPSAHGPGPIGPKGPLGSPGETPLGSQGTPPGIPRDPLKLLFFKNRFFKKISVMLHQWVFYRTYPYDNTIFDNDFFRCRCQYGVTPPKYGPNATFMKIGYFLRNTDVLRCRYQKCL